MNLGMSHLTAALFILAIAAYVAIAAAATMHVLLGKSDVRAALGWIGVVWLAPFLGAFLYYVFGINRVTRRALRLTNRDRQSGNNAVPPSRPPLADNIALLAEIGQRVTRNALMPGNGVSLLNGGDEAYPSMLAAIRAARHSVALASYIFRSDGVGDSFVDALIEARQRGVAVRVLLDGIGSGYLRSATLRRLTSGKVPVARFLHTWMPWRMPFLNMRNHKKLLIVDGVIGFTGGLNIGREYSAGASPKKYVDNLHVRIEGPVVRQLMETFARDWSFTTGELLDQDVWWPAAAPAGPVFARGIHSGPDADIYSLERLLGAALAQAKSHVRIVTPYFFPEQSLEFAIAQAVLRGVVVDILIPVRCDYVALDWAMRAHLRFFSDIPANVFFTPFPFDHTKIMTVDGEWCLVGSSNWDARSLRLNFEFDLECYDRTLTAAVDALVDAKIARSTRLDRNELFSKTRAIQLRDAAVRLFLPYL